MTLFDFSRTARADRPFRHARIPGILDRSTASRVLCDLEDGAPWKLRVEDFYEQHEFSLMDDALPPGLRSLSAPDVVEAVTANVSGMFEEAVRFCDASVHRLTSGQTIRVHNDHLGDEESHRLLIQLNDGWTPEWGGLLMLFNSDDPADLADIVAPETGSGFAFEISANSHHAVSTAHSGLRYTIVYTFRRA